MPQLDITRWDKDVERLTQETAPDGIKRGIISSENLVSIHRYRGVPFRVVETGSGTINAIVPCWPTIKRGYSWKYCFGGSGAVSISRGDPIRDAKEYIDKDYPKNWENKIE